jgi:hypothetical protein
MASFTPERLIATRRVRAARRLFKRFPLFAHEMMQEKYPDYSYQDFLNDLPKKKIKRKSYRRVKNPLRAYGRFFQIESMLSEYQATLDPLFVLKAQKLRDRITKPYEIVVRKAGVIIEYSIPAFVSYKAIEQLVSSFREARSIDEVQQLFKNFSLFSTSGK